jgi:hypothetical protein
MESERGAMGGAGPRGGLSRPRPHATLPRHLALPSHASTPSVDLERGPFARVRRRVCRRGSHSARTLHCTSALFSLARMHCVWHRYAALSVAYAFALAALIYYNERRSHALETRATTSAARGSEHGRSARPECEDGCNNSAPAETCRPDECPPSVPPSPSPSPPPSSSSRAPPRHVASSDGARCAHRDPHREALELRASVLCHGSHSPCTCTAGLPQHLTGPCALCVLYRCSVRAASCAVSRRRSCVRPSRATPRLRASSRRHGRSIERTTCDSALALMVS